jgi:hypothetical protein
MVAGCTPAPEPAFPDIQIARGVGGSVFYGLAAESSFEAHAKIEIFSQFRKIH